MQSNLIPRARQLLLLEKFPVRDAKMTSGDQEVLSLFLSFLKVKSYFSLFSNSFSLCLEVFPAATLADACQMFCVLL